MNCKGFGKKQFLPNWRY